MDNILTQTQGYNRTNKYQPITTQYLIDLLVENGFEVRNVQASRVRQSSKDGFQRHIVRVGHPDFQLSLDGLTPEIVIINSHDGSSSLRIMLGLYRMVCANGLIAGTSYSDYRVRHIGNNVESKVLQSLHAVQDQLPKLVEQIQRFQSLRLDTTQEKLFAQYVADYMLKDKTDIYKVYADSLVETIRRDADAHDDLFTILNRVQENAMHGTLVYDQLKYIDAGFEIKTKRLRPIRAIDKQVKLNQFIWEVAEKMAA
jgi:hypothetical protein